MIKKLLSLFILLSQLAVAQSPQSFKYQSVVRDASGVLAANRIISIRTSILAGSATGGSVYTETQTLTTNDYGVVSLNIGAGTVVNGNFTTISWGTTTYFVKTELDINGGSTYIFMGTSQILSVPYALYAEKAGNAMADHDTSSTNELQTLSVAGHHLSISNGNTVLLPPDADSSATNELQNLSVSGHSIAISSGNNVMLPRDTLTVNGYTLGVSNGNTVNLPAPQNLSVSGHSIAITNGNSVVLPRDTLAVAGHTISISNGNAVALPPPQNLAIVGDSLHITSGNTIYLSGAVDLDSDPTNELQNLTLHNDTLKISRTNSTVVFPRDNDRDSTNELQNLSIVGRILSISKGNTINLPPDGDTSSTNEIQNISISNDTIKLSKNGGFIKLPPTSIQYSPQLYSNGTGMDGNFSSNGNSSLTSTKNYYNFHLHLGDTLFISNTAMLKVQDSCIIEGVIMGKGGATLNYSNTTGGTGGGGGGFESNSLGCAGTIISTTAGTTASLIIDQFSPSINVSGGVFGTMSTSINPLNNGGGGQAFPLNSLAQALNSTSLPYLNGTKGGSNGYAGCSSLSYNGGLGGAGIYIICKYFIFNGIINIKGGDGYNCPVININPCLSNSVGTATGGGSGAGGGGIAVIKTNFLVTNSGTILSNGGNGGIGGTANFHIQLSGTCNPVGGIDIVGGSGGNGGNGGSLIIVQ